MVELPWPGPACKMEKKSKIYMAYEFNGRTGHQINGISKLIHTKRWQVQNL